MISICVLAAVWKPPGQEACSLNSVPSQSLKIVAQGCGPGLVIPPSLPFLLPLLWKKVGRVGIRKVGKVGQLNLYHLSDNFRDFPLPLTHGSQIREHDLCRVPKWTEMDERLQKQVRTPIDPSAPFSGITEVVRGLRPEDPSWK